MRKLFWIVWFSQGPLHKLLCSGLFDAQALQAGSCRVYNTDRYCIKQGLPVLWDKAAGEEMQ